MDAVVFLLISLMFVSESVTGETESNINGFIHEPLDLVCIQQRKGNMIVARYLSNLKQRFVSSQWNRSTNKYTNWCNEHHKLNKLCSSQVKSDVTNNDQETHFVISSTPPYLNGYETVCEYGTSKENTRGIVQTIKLRDKKTGYVGGIIEIECPIIDKCNESETVGLKLNMEFVKRIEFRQSKKSFHCVNGSYVNLCQDQMNSSYVNGSRVIFVFEKIPASLNNTKLYCVAKFTCIHEDTYHDAIEKIIILQYKGTTPTTAPNTTTSTNEKTTPQGTTPTTAPNTTTSTNETTTPQDEEGLSGGEIAGIVVGVLIAVIAIGIIALIIFKRRRANNNHNAWRVRWRR